MFKKILIVSLCLFSVPVLAAEVTVENFVRAESDHMMRANMKASGIGVGKLIHLREPTTPENQPVIRVHDHRRHISLANLGLAGGSDGEEAACRKTSI